MARTASQLTWWGRPGLEVRAGRLAIAGRDAESIAREHGTPLYVHDLVRVEEQARALQGALGRAGLRHRVRLALKAQREPAFLAFLRALGAPGTPGERRDGRVLARGDPVGARSRVGARGDQLHGDEPVRPGPRCRPRRRRPPERRPADASWTGSAGARPVRRSASASTRGSEPPSRAGASPTPETGRRSSGSIRSGSTRRSTSRVGTTSRSTRCTCTRATSISPMRCPSSTRRCGVWPPPRGC